MSKVFAAFADRNSVHRSSLRFLFHGKEIIDDDTAQTLKLKDGDQLNATAEHPSRIDSVERVVGKEAADRMKQGEGFTGKLNLHLKWITDEGLRTIAPALRTMTNLKNLSLDNNNIGDDSIAVLCSRVLPEISLKRLYLDGNKIGNVGCQSLLELFNNGSLPSLNGLMLFRNPNISSELKEVFKRDWKAKGKNPNYLSI
jgi:hypothetical protein